MNQKHEWTLTLAGIYPKEGLDKLELQSPIPVSFAINGITVDLAPDTNIKDYWAIIYGGKTIRDKDGAIYPNMPSFEMMINSRIFMAVPLMSIPNSNNWRRNRNPLTPHQNSHVVVNPGATIAYRIKYPCKVPVPSKTDNTIIIELKGKIGV